VDSPIGRLSVPSAEARSFPKIPGSSQGTKIFTSSTLLSSRCCKLLFSATTRHSKMNIHLNFEEGWKVLEQGIVKCSKNLISTSSTLLSSRRCELLFSATTRRRPSRVRYGARGPPHLVHNVPLSLPDLTSSSLTSRDAQRREVTPHPLSLPPSASGCQLGHAVAGPLNGQILFPRNRI
jgi:hypothetical protein